MKAGDGDSAGYLVKVYPGRLVAQAGGDNQWLLFVIGADLTVWSDLPDENNLRAILARVNERTGSNYTTIEAEPSEFEAGAWTGPEVQII